VRRLLILLIALDHLALVLLTLGNCHRGETLSAAAWSLEHDGKFFGRIFRPAIDALFYVIEENHCSKSWLIERRIYKDAK
jgi:hypothetical protein